MTERIVAAAIDYNSIILTLMPPANHKVIEQKAVNIFGLEVELATGCIERGFITSTGRFVNRCDAAEVAYKAGQVDFNYAMLHPADLWYR